MVMHVCVCVCDANNGHITNIEHICYTLYKDKERIQEYCEIHENHV